MSQTQYEVQLQTFVITIVTGIIIGLMFDSFRVIREVCKFNYVVTAVADLLFWLMATAIIFFALLLGNWGELRFYIFLGIFLGAYIYFKLFSRYMLWSVRKIYHIIFRVIVFAKKAVYYTLIRPALAILRFIGRYTFWQRQ